MDHKDKYQTSQCGCVKDRQTDGRQVCQVKTEDSRGQHHGHGVIENALSKQQNVQIHVHLQLVEDGQHRHCRTRDTVTTFRLSTEIEPYRLEIIGGVYISLCYIPQLTFSQSLK